MMAVLVAGIFWIGIYPQPILRRMEPSAALFVRSVESGQANMSTAERGTR
jgi:NADH:ubiquinone oxidoreductase subunit 4 (subunit M)